MAYEFDATASEYLSLSRAGVDRNLSMSCWWYPDTNGDYEFFATNTTTEFVGMGHRNDAGTYKLRLRDTATQTLFGSAMALSTWHHCGCVLNSNTADDPDVYLYTNGSEVSANWGNLQGGARTIVSIGALGDSTPSNEADGKVAECAMWAAELTQAEMNILAAGYSPLFVRPQSLIFYTPLVSGVEEWIGGTPMTVNGTPPGASPHPRIIYPKWKELAVGSDGVVVGAGHILGEHSMGHARRLVR